MKANENKNKERTMRRIHTLAFVLGCVVGLMPILIFQPSWPWWGKLSYVLVWGGLVGVEKK